MRPWRRRQQLPDGSGFNVGTLHERWVLSAVRGGTRGLWRKRLGWRWGVFEAKREACSIYDCGAVLVCCTERWYLIAAFEKSRPRDLPRETGQHLWDSRLWDNSIRDTY